MAQAQEAVIVEIVSALGEKANMAITRACRLLGMPRATYYRLSRGYKHYTPVVDPIPHRQRHQPAALTEEEFQQVLVVLLDPELADKSLVQAYWIAFDAKRVSCSQRQFYRIASAQGMAGDRRRGRHSGGSGRKKPVVHAAEPNQLWSWDITMLRGPGRHLYRLYLAIDVYSRYPVAWRIEIDETGRKATEMFIAAFARHGAPKFLHADNGAAMRSKDIAEELSGSPTSRSFSRPRVSNDNPFSESLFKTLKYDLAHPDRFESIDHAREWTADFLHRYATEHRHSGLGRYTPQQVYTRKAKNVRRARQRRLNALAKAHPERFRKPPQATPLPKATGINHLSQTG